jgi:putative transcriptional regulator
MSIQVRLDRLMLENKISLTELAERVDLTLANLSILKNNKARAIRFSTLEALCRELDCQPGDLLVYDKGAPSPATGNGPNFEPNKFLES